MSEITDNKKIPWSVMFPASLLVAGNLLGVGVLALPVKVGLSGYIPGVIEIIVIASLMLISAYVIAARLSPDKKNFDIPSFFKQELGGTGKWIAIICNLILLYGVLIAYLSAISEIVRNLLPVSISPALITIIYFLVVTSLVLFGKGILRKGNTIILIAVFIAFVVLVKTGLVHFNSHLLVSYAKWKYLPLGLPVAVSAFHFHNIIPTVSRFVKHRQKEVRKVIGIGVGIGLLLNLIWATVVLGTLAPNVGTDSILYSFLHGLPATIPMTDLLHSTTFATAGMIFAGLAVSASYVANGTGLFGFIKDMTFTYWKIENRIFVGCLAFIIPLVVTLVYPNIFLSAVDIVGGVGETILFLLLPGVILFKMCREKYAVLRWVAYLMIVLGAFITIFLVLEKLGLVHLAPTIAQYKV